MRWLLSCTWEAHAFKSPSISFGVKGFWNFTTFFFFMTTICRIGARKFRQFVERKHSFVVSALTDKKTCTEVSELHLRVNIHESANQIECPCVLWIQGLRRCDFVDLNLQGKLAGKNTAFTLHAALLASCHVALPLVLPWKTKQNTLSPLIQRVNLQKWQTVKTRKRTNRRQQTHHFFPNWNEKNYALHLEPKTMTWGIFQETRFLKNWNWSVSFKIVNWRVDPVNFAVPLFRQLLCDNIGPDTGILWIFSFQSCTSHSALFTGFILYNFYSKSCHMLRGEFSKQNGKIKSYNSFDAPLGRPRLAQQQTCPEPDIFEWSKSLLKVYISFSWKVVNILTRGKRCTRTEQLFQRGTLVQILVFILFWWTKGQRGSQQTSTSGSGVESQRAGLCLGPNEVLVSNMDNFAGERRTLNWLWLCSVSEVECGVDAAQVPGFLDPPEAFVWMWTFLCPRERSLCCDKIRLNKK